MNTYLAAVPKRYRMALTLAFWCGLRSGELRALRRSDLNLREGALFVH